MAKELTVFWCTEDKEWAWKTKSDEGAIEELTDLFDVLAEEGKGSTLVVVDKAGKRHKGVRSFSALPSFGGKKPAGKNIWSWDKEQVLIGKRGSITLEDRA